MEALQAFLEGPQLSALAQAAGIGEILHKPLVSRDIAEALARALRVASDGFANGASGSSAL